MEVGVDNATPIKVSGGSQEQEIRRHADSTEAHFRPEHRTTGSKANIMVVVRVRPLLPTDREGKNVVRVLDNKLVVILDPTKVRDETDVLRQNRSREKKYAFDYVFNEKDDQVAVYSNTTKFMIQGVLDGYNATVFAYGQTGAGKTYTMIGNESSPGIMVQTLQDLFLASQSHESNFKISVSFLEVTTRTFAIC